MSAPREMSVSCLYKLPSGDYIQASTVVPVGSTVYITENADKDDHNIQGPYIARSIETNIKVFPVWTSQTVWIYLEKRGE